MVKAFVFGKFLPFHKGHEAMIRFACTQCDRLTVLVCCSDRETMSGETRRAWISRTFEGNDQIEVRVYIYQEDRLPNTSQADIEVSRRWSEVFNTEVPGHALLVTSEPYGDMVASFMGVEHRLFDMSRTVVPISATAVRNDRFATWTHLPDAVKRDLAVKVVILGTESTGKSTLTRRLAEHYHATSVSEAGRDLVADSNACTWDDLPQIAITHATRIDRAGMGDSPLVIIDTDIHITRSYAEFLFGRTLDVDSGIDASNRADLHLYLGNDVEHVQDGTRLDKADRDRLDVHHREILRRHQVDLVEIRGSWEDRFEKAVAEIDRLIASMRRIEA